MRRTLAVGCLVAALGYTVAWTPASGQTRDDRWTGSVARGNTVEIKGINGDIQAEAASGNQVEVVWVKRSRRSDPASVEVRVVPHDGNVTICAVYPTPERRWPRNSPPNECAPNHGGRMNVKDNDVAVDFTVRLPEGVKLAAHTVNGSIEARSIRSDAVVHTVNGRIALSTTGAGSAKSVNGSINATLGALTGSGTSGSASGATVVGTPPLEFETVNGSITLNIPKDANAQLRARLVNGRFDSNVPLLVQSFRSRPRAVDGTIGKGGRQLDLHTVNGSIHLQFATD